MYCTFDRYLSTLLYGEEHPFEFECVATILNGVGDKAGGMVLGGVLGDEMYAMV